MDSSSDSGCRPLNGLILLGVVGQAGAAWGAGAEGPAERGPGWTLLAILALLAVHALLAAGEVVLLRADGRPQPRSEGLEGERREDRRSTDAVRMLATAWVARTAVLYIACVQAILAAQARLQGPFSGVWLVAIGLAVVAVPGAGLAPVLYASARGEAVARLTSPVLHLLSRLLAPLVGLLMEIARFLLWPLGVRRLAIDPPIHEEEIQAVILAGAQQGVLPAEQSRMLSSVFRFGDRVVQEIMVPRTEMVALPIDLGVPEALDRILETHYGRFPVYRDSPDQIVGLLSLRDLLTVAAGEEEEAATLADLSLHPPYLVPETKPVAELLREMQGAQISLALVIDEFGGVGGLVTLEDILEEVVGDISHEQAGEAPEIQTLAPGRFLCKGTLAIEKVNQATGLHFPIQGDYETLAGFILQRLGRIPRAGDVVDDRDWRLQVESMKERRIEWVQVSRKATPEPARQAQTSQG